MPEPLFLVGPTCCGKSCVAIPLALSVGAEIVSADSMQVYRGMDIATAKPGVEECKKVPHHMIDVVDITEEYDVSQYIESAGKAIRDIKNKGKIPLITGGTGLYIKALVDGLFPGPGRDTEVRNRLEDRIKEEGLSAVHEELKKVDPLSCVKIKKQDKRRIIRALEVYYITGKPISSFQKEWEKKRDCIMIGIMRDRKDLYTRIDKRVNEMFEGGVVEETKGLLEKGLMQNKTAIQALGCKEVIGYLQNRYDIDEAKRLLKQNTRRFAKRQLTWFRKDARIKWVFAGKDEGTGDILNGIMAFLNLDYSR